MMIMKQEGQAAMLVKDAEQMLNRKEDVESMEQMGKEVRFFQQQVRSKNIPSMVIEIGKEHLEDIVPNLIEQGLIQNKNEFCRLLAQNEVSLNQEKLVVDDLERVLYNDEVLQIGENRFLRFEK